MYLGQSSQSSPKQNTSTMSRYDSPTVLSHIATQKQIKCRSKLVRGIQATNNRCLGFCQRSAECLGKIPFGVGENDMVRNGLALLAKTHSRWLGIWKRSLRVGRDEEGGGKGIEVARNLEAIIKSRQRRRGRLKGGVEVARNLEAIIKSRQRRRCRWEGGRGGKEFRSDH
ncbi:hypothetical protein BHM03_00013129 [Ensete ventricosum]|nr:hypothetical protein BHM03_00013129 [Ensete ventricosum]